MSIVPETERQLRDAAERVSKRPVSRALERGRGWSGRFLKMNAAHDALGHERRSRYEGRRRVGRVRGLATGSLVVACACVLGLVLAGGSSGPGVDVAAAAYQATSPGDGVLEAQFVDHLFQRGRLVATVQRREWIDASEGIRRAQGITHPMGHGCESVLLESATAPGHIEFASGAGACPRSVEGHSVPRLEVIHRFDLGQPPEVFRRLDVRRSDHRAPRQGTAASKPAPAVKPSGRPRATAPPEVVLGPGRDNCRCSPTGDAFQGASLPLETEGLDLYRRLYQARVIRLAGRVRMDGRLLWKLEGSVGWASSNTRAGRFRAILGLVVLVDPKTFRPVLQRELNLALPGHPVTVESQLISYRRLPHDAASEALLQVSAQHPGVRVITTRSPFPHVVFRDR